MTVINTNVGALTARTYSIKANDAMQQSMERLSSGLRINSAADDAAGLAVANKMESQLRGMNVAIRNSQDGISLVQTAEAGMGEISNMVIRMRELAVQMNNGVYTSADRSNAQLEVSALLAEIDKIADNTAFNDVKVLDGSYSADIRAGNTNNEVITVTIDRMKTDTIGGNYITTGVVSGVGNTADYAGPIVGKTGATTITVKGGDLITINKSELSKEFDATISGSFANKYDGTAVGASKAFTLSGTDAGSFDISATGDITVKSGTKLDPTKSKYEFNVVYTHTDSAGEALSFTDKVTANVTAGVAGTAGQTGSNITVATVEETDTFTALDVDKTLTHAFYAFTEANSGGTYSISGGADSTKFQFATNTASTLTLAAGEALNFENKDDANSNATYELEITYTKGANAYTEKLNIAVTNNTTDDSLSDTTNIAGDFVITTGANGTAENTVNLGVPGAGGASFTWATDGITNSQFSAAARAFITANGAVSYTAAISADNTTGDVVSLTGASGATGFTVGNGAAALEDATVDLTITATSGKTFVETIKVAVVATGTDTQAAPGTSPTANTFITQSNLVTKETVAITGSSLAIEKDGVYTVDLATAANFVSLAAFKGASTLTYAFSGSSTGTQNYSLSAAPAALGTLTINGNANETIEVTATRAIDNKTFVQTITVNPNDVVNGAGAAKAAAWTSGVAPATAGTQTAREVNGGMSKLTFEEARQGSIKVSSLNSHLSTFATANKNGTYTVTGTDKDSFNVDSKTGELTTKGLVDFETKASYAINLVYTSGNKSYTEAIDVKVNDSAVDAGTHLIDVDLSTSAGAATAVTILDKALGQISSSQAKLGAIQNRLQHNIDNLSMASMLTETARGRVVDADFARETSELSKQQILGQAATSMLAQANQSKQSVLALLQ
ncbi:flagellin [Alphaproteobacteria bacterium]|nr:flagellin [Alphaproteobacteria bacterium]